MGMASDREVRWSEERRRRNRRGSISEHLAAWMLRLKGYRILGRRVRTGAGEIDLVAVRGNRLTFVEVKQRQTLDGAEASISERQRKRVRRAAELWIAKRPRYQEHEQGFDLVLVAPRRWPRHVVNGL